MIFLLVFTLPHTTDALTGIKTQTAAHITHNNTSYFNLCTLLCTFFQIMSGQDILWLTSVNPADGCVAVQLKADCWPRPRAATDSSMVLYVTGTEWAVKVRRTLISFQHTVEKSSYQDLPPPATFLCEAGFQFQKAKIQTPILSDLRYQSCQSKCFVCLLFGIGNIIYSEWREDKLHGFNIKRRQLFFAWTFICIK